jgi:hypothetical protein
MADTTPGKFVELIFEPASGDTSRHRLGYRSLARNSKQLFTLLLKKEVSTEFFLAFETYGKRLATLLRDIPKYFAEYQLLQSAKEHITLRLLEETIGAFLFSLLPSQLPGIPAQKSMAEIVMAVIEVSRPGGLLGLIGAELGERPVTLAILILDGLIGTWSKKQAASFRSLILNCWETWANLMQHHMSLCDSHRGKPNDWEGMKKLVESFPCDSCSASVHGTDETPPPRAKPRPIHITMRAFDNLVGEHLGPWKIVVSAFALKRFREAAANGECSCLTQSVPLAIDSA